MEQKNDRRWGEGEGRGGGGGKEREKVMFSPLMWRMTTATAGTNSYLHLTNRRCTLQVNIGARNTDTAILQHLATYKGVNQPSKYVTQVQEQRPESPTVTLTWQGP